MVGNEVVGVGIGLVMVEVGVAQVQVSRSAELIAPQWKKKKKKSCCFGGHQMVDCHYSETVAVVVAVHYCWSHLVDIVQGLLLVAMVQAEFVVFDWVVHVVVLVVVVEVVFGMVCIAVGVGAAQWGDIVLVHVSSGVVVVVESSWC